VHYSRSKKKKMASKISGKGKRSYKMAVEVHQRPKTKAETPSFEIETEIKTKTKTKVKKAKKVKTSEHISLEFLYSKSTLKSQSLDDGRDEEVSGRNIVYQGITLQDFERMLQKGEDRTRGRLLFAEGSIILYEIPSRLHDDIASTINYLFQQHFRAACAVSFSPTCTSIAGGWSKEPDGCVIPLTKPNPGPASPLRADNDGNAWPNVVIEIAASDTLTDVLNDAARWLGPHTSVQVLLSIMVWRVTIAHGVKSAQMVALRFRRVAPQVPDHIISFGSKHLHHATATSFNKVGWPTVTGYIAGVAVCNAAGMPNYQLPIPSADVYHGAILPVNAPANYDIDLYEIKNALLR